MPIRIPQFLAKYITVESAEPKKRRPIRNSFFDGADVNRFNFDWLTSNATFDSLLETDLERLRSRSRSLCANDGYAYRFMWELKANVLGENGIRFKSAVRTKSGKKLDATANRQIEEAWEEFGQAKNFTVTGEHSRHSFDCLNLESIARDGGALTRMVQNWRGNKFRFAVQPWEIDHLDPNFTDGERRISMSVQRDEWGKIIRYWLLKNHPGERFGVAVSDGDRIAFRANEILSPFLYDRFRQSQGRPWIANAIPRLRQLHAYEEAELIAARFHAAKFGFLLEEEGEYQGETEDADGNRIMSGEMGTFERLPAGVKPELIDPSHPNGNYPQFRSGMLRGIATGIFTSYHTLGQDLEGVTYSSIRQGLLSERELWKMIQRWYIDNFIAPLFEEWLRWAMLAGTLPSDWLLEFDRFNMPRFQGRRWAWVDPDKESKAQERRLKLRLTSHQREARQAGDDIGEILDEIEQDTEAAHERQLELFQELEREQEQPELPEE